MKIKELLTSLAHEDFNLNVLVIYIYLFPARPEFVIDLAEAR